MAKKRSWPGEPVGLWDDATEIEPRNETRSAAERLSVIRRGFQFPYPRGERLKAEIVDVMTRERRRYTGAMIVGPRTNGRSTLAREIADEIGDRAWVMEMPVTGCHEGFWQAVIAKAGHYVMNARKLKSVYLEMEAIIALKDQRGRGLKLVIVDHCETLLGVSARRRRLMLHVISSAWGITGAPFILVVTPALASRILADRDFVGENEVLMLPLWRLDADFLDLLRTWDDALPLQHGSGLAHRELAMHLYAVSDGRLGVLAEVLAKAASAAIVGGEERITIELLDRIGLEIPSSFTGFLF